MFDYDAMQAALVGLRNKTVFFVGGTAKSGTTWLRLLLNAHPDVSCHGEAHFGSRLATILWDAVTRHNQQLKNFKGLQDYPPLLDDDFKYLLATTISLSLRRQEKSAAARALGETTPSNIRYFDVLAALFPRAKFVQIVRDGRDAAVSAWFHNMRVSGAAGGDFDAFVLAVAANWASDAATAQAFMTSHGQRMRQIRYEDLIAAAGRALAGLFDFLDVDADAAVVAKCCRAASFAALSGGRAPGQEDRNSFFRKGVVGDWRNHFSAALDAQFRERAGRWLDHFGYALRA